MRKISKDNIVFISEQNAPDDFECIWEKPFTRTLDRNKDNQFKVTEKLYIHKIPIPKIRINATFQKIPKYNKVFLLLREKQITIFYKIA